jgi:hypothetical protein
MKKLLATLLATVLSMAMVVSVSTLTTTATQPRLLGDITNTGKVEIGDALETLKYLAKLDSVLTHSDTDFQTMMSARILNPVPNGVITIGDTLEILKNLAKLDSALSGSPVLPSTSAMLSESLVISTVNPTENGGWLEISNPTAYTATTKCLYLSNDDDDLFLWQMPSLIIRAGQTVRVAMNSNSTCEVLKRLRTNFDIVDGDTVRLSDVRGNVWSVWGGNSSDTYTIPANEMESFEHWDGRLWRYRPTETLSFVVPENQGISAIRIECGENFTWIDYEPGEVISVEPWGEEKAISIFFLEGHGGMQTRDIVVQLVE